MRQRRVVRRRRVEDTPPTVDNLPSRTLDHYDTDDSDLVSDWAAVLSRFDPNSYDPGAIRAHAARFGTDRFRAQITDVLASV